MIEEVPQLTCHLAQATSQLLNLRQLLTALPLPLHLKLRHLLTRSLQLARECGHQALQPVAAFLQAVVETVQGTVAAGTAG